MSNPNIEMTTDIPDQYGQLHPDESKIDIPAMIKEMNAALETIPDKDKVNFMEAETKCPELLTDDFKLQFLRCEIFNIELAAKRFAKYWDKRRDIFGPEKAFQPLTLDKALKDDMDPLSIDFIRLTRSTDSAGRNLLFLDPTKQERAKYTNDTMVKCVWYLFHAALEDTETQKHGLVVMIFPKNAHFSDFNRDLGNQITSSIKGCLPVRLSAFIINHPPTFFRFIFPILQLFLGERLRKRIRVNSGSDAHVLAELEKLGIPKASVPSDLKGDVVLDHQGWLNERKSAGK